MKITIPTFLAAFATLALALPQYTTGDVKSDVKGLGLSIKNYGATNQIPNKYIVVYNSTFSDDDINSYQASVVNTIKKRNIYKRHVSGKRSLSTSIRRVSMGSWRCMALEADDETISGILSSNEVSLC